MVPSQEFSSLHKLKINSIFVQVYVAELMADAHACAKRNSHHWSFEEINKVWILKAVYQDTGLGYLSLGGVCLGVVDSSLTPLLILCKAIVFFITNIYSYRWLLNGRRLQHII